VHLDIVRAILERSVLGCRIGLGGGSLGASTIGLGGRWSLDRTCGRDRLRLVFVSGAWLRGGRRVPQTMLLEKKALPFGQVKWEGWVLWVVSRGFVKRGMVGRTLCRRLLWSRESSS
jgi:hypothetical protein